MVPSTEHSDFVLIGTREYIHLSVKEWHFRNDRTYKRVEEMTVRLQSMSHTTEWCTYLRLETMTVKTKAIAVTYVTAPEETNGTERSRMPEPPRATRYWGFFCYEPECQLHINNTLYIHTHTPIHHSSSSPLFVPFVVDG